MCGENHMKVYSDSRGNKFSRIWTCNRRACRGNGSKPKFGFYAGTFFEGTKIDLKTIFQNPLFLPPPIRDYRPHGLGN